MQGRRLAIRDLLNAEPAPATSLTSVNSQTISSASPRPHPLDFVDIGPQLLRLAKFVNGPGDTPMLTPLSVQQSLNSALEYLESQSGSQRSATVPGIPDTSELSDITVKRSTNIAINRVTTLQILYEYPVGYGLEYPETSSTGSVGHLFRMDPNDWQDPALNIAYSRGGNMGQSLSGTSVKCRLLVDGDKNLVECAERHTTCQGSKICPNSDVDELSIPHNSASREDVRERLRKDQTEEEDREAKDLYLFQTQRGYRMKDGLCEGRIVFDYGDDDRSYISCEHYNPRTNKDHFNDHSYIEVVISGDEEEATRIEKAVLSFGYGPLANCSTVANCSQQKAYCPFPHRDETKNLTQPLMNRLECESKFRVFEPKEEYRMARPFVLIVTTGAHPHPVPLPIKTPPKIRSQLMELLGMLAEDLPDITPRRFVRHPIVRAFLTSKFPSIVCPTLADWHVSLSNRSHVKSYIKQAIEGHCPFGTGWNGVVHLKAQQDANLPPKQRYIRRIIAIPVKNLARHAEDEDEPDCKDDMIRIIICMAVEAISPKRHAFKRIVGFLEFELACMDRDANTSLVFCRVYINRQTAAAHQRVFEEIEAIVREDTNRSLQWRHLHASRAEGAEEYNNLILSWTADQHRGQAKGQIVRVGRIIQLGIEFWSGIGLHLQKIATNMPLKADLHEPGHNIQDLDAYDHLRRIFRICTVHNFRDIKKCPVPEDVRWLMRSFVCVEHDDWDGTLLKIREKGGKAGNDWVNDKESSKFFFPGICWDRSFIPIEIWNAGDANSNLIESVHQDVNREGVHCTLLGGLKKGQFFDALKIKTLVTYESFGVTPSFKTGHISENAFHNLKRKFWTQWSRRKRPCPPKDENYWKKPDQKSARKLKGSWRKGKKPKSGPGML
ncbi:hypothetical protein K438DRAFT_2166815 [Mycena galopus ATCC 62051]|nr:hypothetical protein K438DRAFT_2166815 [Mycena galopus ATCC 62051]